jgi:4,5-dihydroxyphthalate decarboxylase
MTVRQVYEPARPGRLQWRPVPKNLSLTLACGTYDINQALISGDVSPQGIDLTVLTYPSPERHWRMSRNREFDVCELSLGETIAHHGRGEFPLVAVPAFPHRRFRHGFIFVNTAAGVRVPKDLDGRRVGLRTWTTTAGLWARGILQDDHGVDLSSIDWVCQDDEDVALDLAGRYRLRRAPAGDSVVAMLERGDLDALIYPDPLESIERGDPRVARLFPDSRAAEIDHFSRTGFFPLMHTVVIQAPIVEAHPWVARNIHDAFVASKDRAFRAMRDPRRVSLAWFREALEEQERVLGRDPWSYAFEPNRAALEAMIRWSHEQAIIARPFPAEELFAASTLEAVPTYV